MMVTQLAQLIYFLVTTNQIIVDFRLATIKYCYSKGLRVKGYYAGGLPIFAWTAYETNTGSFTHQLSGIHNFACSGITQELTFCHQVLC